MSKSPTPKESLPEYKQFADLKANFIGMREAARKYKVPVTTLHTWLTLPTLKGCGVRRYARRNVGPCQRLYSA